MKKQDSSTFVHAIPSRHARQRMKQRSIPWNSVRATLRAPWLIRRHGQRSDLLRLIRPAMIRDRWCWLTVVLSLGERGVVVTAFTVARKRRRTAR